MPPSQKPTSPPNPDQIRQAISLFEGLLVSQPDDRVALEALSLAYTQVGETARGRASLVRLAHVLVRDADLEAAAGVAERLRPFANDDLDALEALRAIEALTVRPAAGQTAAAPPAGPPAHAAAPRTPVSDVALGRRILRREMSLAWDLLQTGDLSQDDYATVIQDLTNLTGDGQVRTISVLHDLVDRSLPCFERVLAGLAKRSGRPVIPLSAFDPQTEAYDLLPFDYMVRQGVFPFDRLGNELLVALLNPLDEELRRDVVDMAGRPCHFFLATPADFDAALQLVQNRAAGLVADAPPTG